MKNFFFNNEFIELSRKNLDFTLDLMKNGAESNQKNAKKMLEEYFSYLTGNIDFVTKNYQEALKTNQEIATIYRENLNKVWEMTKKATEPPQKNEK
ncbi:MAG: hypothetical protein PHW04_04090 [Candidatus Wallbacteria bacterium]|nr:hypothetical protein [Candidatus Wallbacteria bacterium]